MKNETKNKKRSTKSLFRRMVKLGKRGRNSRKWAAKIQVISFIVYYYSNFLKFDYITGEFFLLYLNLLQDKSFHHLLGAQIRDRGIYFMNQCTFLLR